MASPHPDSEMDIFDSGVESDRQRLAQQLAAAKALRDKPMPRGRDTGAMYVAANPLELLHGAVTKAGARGEVADILGQQKALVEGKEQFRRQLGGEIQALPPLPVPEMLSTDEDIQKAQQSMGAHLGVANKALASADPGLKALGQQIHGDVKNVYAGLVKSREKIQQAALRRNPRYRAALVKTMGRIGISDLDPETPTEAMEFIVGKMAGPEASRYAADTKADSAVEVQKLKNLMAQVAAGKGQLVLGPDGNYVLVSKTTATSTPVTAPGGAEPLRAGKPIEPDVQKLEADTAFLKDMPADLALLKKYVGKDRPGGGPIEGRLADWMTSEEGNAQRQAAQRLINALVYMQSGKQINEAETRRLMLAEGIAPSASQAAFNQGIKSFEAKLKRAATEFKAKYRPEVIETLRQRGGLSWLDQLGNQSKGKVVRTGTNIRTGKKVVQYEDGSTEEQ